MSQQTVRGIEEALLWGLPADIIRNALDAADGGEIASGKIFSERSSSALALNAFGPFFAPDRASRLSPLPGSEMAGWPARSVRPEAKLPFPWARGRRPNMDVLIETDGAFIGVEAKRREPFDTKSAREWQRAYLDHDWGGGMQRYCAARDGALGTCRHLDTGQLVRHAFGLATATGRGGPAQGKQAILYYLHARPRDVRDSILAAHLAEIERFAALVAGDDVQFLHSTYDSLLAAWGQSGDRHLVAHVAALRAFFPDTF
jgi:hypothetical protein